MAGLDTRGAFDGFTQGFGMMQNYKDSQDRKEYMKQQQGMQERGMEMREQEFSAQQDERQKQQDQQAISQFYEGWSSGIEAPITPELEKVFSRNSMADPRHLFKPETEAAVQYADKLAKGEGSLFSQETVDAMNNFYAPRVGRGGGGSKRLAGLYPGQKEGTLVFVVEVEDEQGNTRLAPMTMNRGLEGEDDEVAQYEIDQAIGPVMGAKSIYQALGENREKMMSYLQSSGYIKKPDAKWEEVKGPGGSILQRNTATGEMKNVLGRAPVAGGSGYGSSKLTQQQDNFHFLKNQLNMSDEDAYKAAFGGTGAVTGKVAGDVQAGINLLSAQIKEIDSRTAGKAGLMLPEEERASLMQQRSQLEQERQALADSAGVLGSTSSQQSPGLQMPQQAQQPQQPAQANQPAASDMDQQIRSLNLW